LSIEFAAQGASSLADTDKIQFDAFCPLFCWLQRLSVYICPMRMTISGLPRHFDKFDLQRLFNTFGWVDYTKIIIDPLSGLSKGKGIVEMKQDDQAKKAMAELQGKVLGTNPLNIKEVKEGGFKPQ